MGTLEHKEFDKLMNTMTRAMHCGAMLAVCLWSMLEVEHLREHVFVPVGFSMLTNMWFRATNQNRRLRGTTTECWS